MINRLVLFVKREVLLVVDLLGNGGVVLLKMMVGEKEDYIRDF